MRAPDHRWRPGSGYRCRRSRRPLDLLARQCFGRFAKGRHLASSWCRLGASAADSARDDDSELPGSKSPSEGRIGPVLALVHAET